MHQQGFALAATAHSDRGAAAALSGMSEATAAHAARLARELRGREPSERRAWLRDVLAPRPLPAGPHRGHPARALSLLAAHAEPSIGRSWLESAPLPRAGFTPDPRLVALLRALLAGPAADRGAR